MKTRPLGERPLTGIWTEDGKTWRLCDTCGNRTPFRRRDSTKTCKDCRDVERGFHWRPGKRN